MTESTTGLNNAGGNYNTRVSNRTITEDGEIIFDSNVQEMYIETSQPVGEIVSTPQISSNLILTDKKHMNQNRIYLESYSNNPAVYNLEGTTTTVKYQPVLGKNGDKHAGKDIGFQGEETGSIYVISNNMNVLRCLSSLVTFVLLTMRATNENDAPFPNLNIQREGISTIQDAFGIKNVDEYPLYAIKFSVSTIATYMVSYDTENAIKDFNIMLSSKEKDSD